MPVVSGFCSLTGSTRACFSNCYFHFVSFRLFPWLQTFFWPRWWFLNNNFEKINLNLIWVHFKHLTFASNWFEREKKSINGERELPDGNRGCNFPLEYTWEDCDDCDDWLPLDESRFRFLGDDLLFSFSSSIDILAIGLSILVLEFVLPIPRFWLVDFGLSNFFDLFLGANRAGEFVFFGDSFAACLFEFDFLPFEISESGAISATGLLVVALLLASFPLAAANRSAISASFSRSLSSDEACVDVIFSSDFLSADLDFLFCFWLSFVPRNNSYYTAKWFRSVYTLNNSLFHLSTWSSHTCFECCNLKVFIFNILFIIRIRIFIIWIIVIKRKLFPWLEFGWISFRLSFVSLEIIC